MQSHDAYMYYCVQSQLNSTFVMLAYACVDVCHSGQQDGVEIVSLLEENLSLYRLRADTVHGYDNDDWLHTPLVSSNVDLSFDVIDETFKYMLLCAERVGQITKTYSDIDAVTRLLEEKERDLELTARIGQSLLKKVKVLTERNDYLEEKIDHVTEEVSQLRHDLSLKDDLLHIYTNNGAESDASHLKNETVDYEEKEKQLVNDCVKELKETSTQLTTLTEELMRRSDEAARQQEEITQLLAQVVDLQRKVKMFATDNDELNQHLAAAKDAQRELTSELRYIKEKMQQCTDMLHEAQEEAKNLRNKAGLQTTSPRWFHPLVNFPMDSLAAEIEGTMRRELEDSIYMKWNLFFYRCRGSWKSSDTPQWINRQNGAQGKQRDADKDALSHKEDLRNGRRRFSLISFVIKVQATTCSQLHGRQPLMVVVLTGSTTLQQWQHLAQPNLGGILDMRPGVLTKGNSTCDARVSRGLAVPEEDEPLMSVFLSDQASYPGKCADNARYTYTLTTCRIIHPTDDATSFTQYFENVSGPICSHGSGITSSAACVRHPHRAESFTNVRDATKTSSTTLGLAKLMQKCGISAAASCRLPSLPAAASLCSRPQTLLFPSTLASNMPTNEKSPVAPLPPLLSLPTRGRVSEPFLASRPATSILREIMGPRGGGTSTGNQTKRSCSHLALVEQLRRLGITLSGRARSDSQSLCGTCPKMGPSIPGEIKPIMLYVLCNRSFNLLHLKSNPITMHFVYSLPADLFPPGCVHGFRSMFKMIHLPTLDHF
uniref:HAP1 N-terminal domain-containing protein n=1 Tax=Eptatretus burgeri TaxID=7764 RepID=A0A8C4N8A5_EPTBU